MLPPGPDADRIVPALTAMLREYLDQSDVTLSDVSFSTLATSLSETMCDRPPAPAPLRAPSAGPRRTLRNPPSPTFCGPPLADFPVTPPLPVLPPPPGMIV